MSTKEQEREALAKIKKIIDSVGGYDSYIGMAFEGAIDDAEDNIENDFGNSYYVRYRSSQDKINVLMDELASDRCVIERLNNELEEAGNRTHELKDQYETLGNQYV